MWWGTETLDMAPLGGVAGNYTPGPQTWAHKLVPTNLQRDQRSKEALVSMGVKEVLFIVYNH